MDVLFPLSIASFAKETIRTVIFMLFIAITVTPLFVAALMLSDKSSLMLSIKIFDLVGAMIAGFLVQLTVMKFKGVDHFRSIP